MRIIGRRLLRLDIRGRGLPARLNVSFQVCALYSEIHPWFSKVKAEAQEMSLLRIAHKSTPMLPEVEVHQKW